MIATIAEIIGIFLGFAGVCALVAAAAMVSIALAVLVAGAFLILAGVLAVYVGVMLDRGTDQDKPSR